MAKTTEEAVKSFWSSSLTVRSGFVLVCLMMTGFTAKSGLEYVYPAPVTADIEIPQIQQMGSDIQENKTNIKIQQNNYDNLRDDVQTLVTEQRALTKEVSELVGRMENE